MPGDYFSRLDHRGIYLGGNAAIDGVIDSEPNLVLAERVVSYPMERHPLWVWIALLASTPALFAGGCISFVAQLIGRSAWIASWAGTLAFVLANAAQWLWAGGKIHLWVATRGVREIPSR